MIDPTPHAVDPSAETEGNHVSAPANAIEITNTAPGHTEDGTGALGGEAGIELSRPEHSPVPPAALTDAVAAPVEVGSLGQNEDKMDVDEPEVQKGEAPEEDAGLVMGEMKPPTGQEDLSVTDQDQVKETEGTVIQQTSVPPIVEETMGTAQS